MNRLIALTLMIGFGVAPASAQFGSIMKRGKQAKQVADASAEWTAGQEQAIGDASAAKLVHVLGLYDDPAMTFYVSQVGNALASHVSRPMPYKFGVLKTDAVTAFGLPGGYVFITGGALKKMKNEAELAGVLAHEIAHVDNRHLEKEVRGKKLTSIAASEGFEQLGNRVPYGSYLQNLGTEVVTRALTMNYSRDKEDEADRKGTELAATTGYSAAGLRDFLASMKEDLAKDPNGKRETGIWGSTHPSFDERIAALTPIAAQYQGGATNEVRFQKGAAFGPTAEELAAQRKAEEEAAAAAKKSAEAKSAPKTQPSKATTKSRFAKPTPK
jgi:predicted Zn-dependent protease